MKVPQYQQGRVAPDSVNQQKISGFVGDGGLGQLGNAVSGVAKQFEQAQFEVDQTIAQERINLLERDYLTIKHDPEHGYFNKSGKDAYDGRGDTLKALEIARKNHLKGLTPAQQRMFNRVADKMDISTRQQVEVHASRGMKAWQVATEEATRENALENGMVNYQNDKELAVQLATMRNSVVNSAKMQGIGAEATNERLQTMTSKFYSGVISRALEDDTGRAKELFKRVEKLLEPADRSVVKKAIKGTIQKQSAIQMADSWMDKGYSISRGMEEARKISDPYLREATEQRFRQIKGIEEQETKKREIESADIVWDAYSKGEIPDNKYIENMSGRARIAYKNAVRADNERKLREQEKAEKEKETEKYQLYAGQVFDGASWDSVKDSVKDLPVEKRKSIKAIAIANTNYKKAIDSANEKQAKDAQKQYFEVLRKSMLTGGLRYDTIAKMPEALKRLDSTQIASLMKVSAAMDKPKVDAQEALRKKQAISRQWQIEQQLYQIQDYDEAKRVFMENIDKFETIGERNRVLNKLNSLNKERAKAGHVDTVIPIMKRIKAVAGKDEAKQMALWQEWDAFQMAVASTGQKVDAKQTDKFFRDAIANKENSSWGTSFEESISGLGVQESKNFLQGEMAKQRDKSNANYVRGFRERFIQDAAKTSGIPDFVIKKQVGQESGYNRNAKSPTGVKGLHQITTSTAKAYGFDPKRVRSNRKEDEAYQWNAYATIMRDMKKQMGGSVKWALVAYNAGPGNAKRMRAGKMPLPIKKKGKVIKTAKQVKAEALGYIRHILGSE